MTDQEIARALESLIREDAKRPSAEQVRELIEAGVIDEEGRVLIGSWDNSKRTQKPGQQKRPGACNLYYALPAQAITSLVVT